MPKDIRETHYPIAHLISQKIDLKFLTLRQESEIAELKKDLESEKFLSEYFRNLYLQRIGADLD